MQIKYVQTNNNSSACIFILYVHESKQPTVSENLQYTDAVWIG